MNPATCGVPRVTRGLNRDLIGGGLLSLMRKGRLWRRARTRATAQLSSTTV